MFLERAKALSCRKVSYLCRVSGWLLAMCSRSRSNRLQCDMCHEPIPSPGERSNQAEKTMYKCQGRDCKTKGKGRQLLDLERIEWDAPETFLRLVGRSTREEWVQRGNVQAGTSAASQKGVLH